MLTSVISFFNGAFSQVCLIPTPIGVHRTTAELPPAANRFRMPSKFFAGAGSTNISAKAELQDIEETGNRSSVEKELDL